LSNPPSYSHKSMFAKALLYTSYNSFTVFVEDSSLEHMYVTIFNRLFPDHTICKVFPLGGRDTVHRAFYAYKNKEVSIPGFSFFLCDLDLEPYLNSILIEDDIFIYLQEYSIENYFIDEIALSKALQWKKGQTAEEIRKRVNFVEWLELVVGAFYRLHVGYVLCRKHALGDNAQKSPYLFIENNGYVPDYSQIEKYLSDLKTEYGEREKEFEEEFEEISKLIITKTFGNKKASISGKYLLASLSRFASNVCDQRIDSDLLLGMLVDHFDITTLYFVRNKILKQIG